jgi:energy-coupling factor transporter transmembrane protein EcfT
VTNSTPTSVIAFLALALASVVHVGAASGLSTIPMTSNPDVISYDVVPKADVAQGGRAVHGLVASLSSTTHIVRVNQPAILTATVTNISSSLRFLYSPYCTYVFSVTKSSTNETRDVRPLLCVDDIYSIPIERLSPGTAAVLTFKFKNSELVGAPGTYTVSLRSISWYPTETSNIEDLQIASNPISIVVTQ